ncbi:MAG: type II toxin-antitoxin system Phd/YefM family antitoxin [Jiangellaceae bacterium]
MKTVPLAEAKNQLSAFVDEIVRTHESVQVTRNGRPAVVILAQDDYESIMERLEIMADPELVAEIAEAERDIVDGRTSTLEEVKAEMRARGRL